MSNNDLWCEKCKSHHHPVDCPLDSEAIVLAEELIGEERNGREKCITEGDIKRLYEYMVRKFNSAQYGHFSKPSLVCDVLLEILPILCPSILEKDSGENNHLEVVSNATQIKHKENDDE